MGARVSIQFKKGTEKSVVLFNHWGGMEFVEEAKTYANKLKATAQVRGGTMPLYRLEPNIVMVDFIAHTTGGNPVESSLRLEATEHEGDNSDYGHHIIEL